MKKEASLSIVEDVKNHKFLMIKHLRGVNKGYVNFPGGKKEENETMEECVIRETFEETAISIKNPKLVGYAEFPGMGFYVYIYKTTEFSGIIQAKEGEVEVFWQDIDNIPYSKMRNADKDYLPDILAGKFVKRRYFYDENGEVTEKMDLE